MIYRREIDGLRALAVLPVIFYHADVPGLGGGFLGVDIFFVISGYLISSIILTEVDAGRFSFIDFYERRARRILPALFFVLFASIPFALAWLMPSDMRSFSQGIVAVIVFSSNLLFWKTSGYFETSTELSPLIHTWSLAVEEQFYVLFPFVLLAIQRFRKNGLLFILAFLFVISLVAANHYSVRAPSAAFYLLPARGWELLTGALIAGLSRKGIAIPFESRRSGGLALVGLGLLLASMVLFKKSTPHPSLYTVIPVLGTALLIAFASPANLVGRLLGSRVVVLIGLCSYSAYLIHQPLLAFARHRLSMSPDLETWLLVLAFSTLPLSYLSWKYIEAPFRNRQSIKARNLWLICGGASVLLMVFGLLGHISGGYPKRLPQRVLDIKVSEMASAQNGWCFRNVESLNDLQKARVHGVCAIGDPAAGMQLTLLGDSFAGQYEPFWDVIGKSSSIKIESITSSWCYPALSSDFPGPIGSNADKYCQKLRSDFRGSINARGVVVVGASWGALYTSSRLDNAIAFIEARRQQGLKTVVMPSPTQFDVNPNVAYSESVLHEMPFDIESLSRHLDSDSKKARAIIDGLCSKSPDIFCIKYQDLFLGNADRADVLEDGRPVSYDGKHVGIEGARFSARNFMASPRYAELQAFLRHGK